MSMSQKEYEELMRMAELLGNEDEEDEIEEEEEPKQKAKPKAQPKEEPKAEPKKKRVVEDPVQDLKDQIASSKSSAEKQIGNHLLEIFDDDTNGLARNWKSKAWTLTELLNQIMKRVKEEIKGNSACLCDEEVYDISHDLIVDSEPKETKPIAEVKASESKAKNETEELIKKYTKKEEPKKEAKPKQNSNDGWNNELFDFLNTL